MAINTQTYMSLEAFEAFIRQSTEDIAYEYIGGRIVEAVSNPLSSIVAATLLSFLSAFVRENQLGYVTGADGGYIVGNGRYIPDVAFISYAKMPFPNYGDGYIDVPPDLAVEVISPANDDSEMSVKVADYLAAGVVVWLVKPLPQVVQVFVPNRSVQTLTLDDVLTGGDVLNGFLLPIREIFPKEPSIE